MRARWARQAGWALIWVATCVLSLASTTGVAHADIYQCRGSDGELHFTNLRTPGKRCKRVIKSSAKQTRQVRRRPGTLPARGPRNRSPERYTMYDPIIRQAARFYQLPEAFVRAVVRVESDFNHDVVSRAGAMGLMQLMPKTAAAMGVSDPFDPRQNIFGGTRFLRVLANKFNGDLVLTIAAYNAGDGAVSRYRGVPPYRETRRYVRRVLTHYYKYKG